MSGPLRPWDHVRAALVAVHVLAVVGTSLPSPEGFSAASMAKKAKFAGPIAAWADALAEVGVPPSLTQTVALRGGQALERAEDRMERLFAPYGRYAGVKQSWRMFSASPSRTSRVEMWLEEGGAWRPIYVPLHPTARWRAELWEDGRVRGAVKALGSDRYREWWAALARSAARRAAADFPTATRFKLQRVSLRIPAPDALARTGRLEERAATGVAEVDLAALRETP